MQFTNELKSLVQKFMLDFFGIHDDLSKTPWHQIVTLSWRAKVFYKMDNYCKNLNELEPTEGMHASVFVWPDKLETYEYENGAWQRRGQLLESMYKEG